ncbi:hypothetical protein U1Q18_052556 [Sarracenia purpurea var. burkii]
MLQGQVWRDRSEERRRSLSRDRW